MQMQNANQAVRGLLHVYFVAARDLLSVLRFGHTSTGSAGAKVDRRQSNHAYTIYIRWTNITRKGKRAAECVNRVPCVFRGCLSVTVSAAVWETKVRLGGRGGLNRRQYRH